MDIQEIARLHARYAEPPLTIDMPSRGHGTPMLEQPQEAAASTNIATMWGRRPEWQRLVVVMLLVTAVAFPIGRWAASGGKRDAQTAVTKGPAAEGTSAGPTEGGSPQSVEWPPKVSVTIPERDAVEPQRAAVPAQQIAGAASTAPAPPVAQTPASSADAAAPRVRAPTKTPTVSPQAPTRATPTSNFQIHATPTQQTPQAPHASEQRRNEIKLF